MGQHKNKPNVKLAKEGFLQKTPKKISKREFERDLIYGVIHDVLYPWQPKKVFGRILS